MKPVFRTLVRALALTAIVAALAGKTMYAQTPESTIITNTATVSWTDANSNPYTPVNASVAVTVGFQAGVDVIARAAVVTPASPSSGNSILFDIKNIGNGDDSVAVDSSFTTAGVITVTGWRLNGAPHADLTALNLALSGTLIAQGDSVLVEMEYDVNAGQGGQSVDYTILANSLRTPATTDSDVTTISPPAGYAVDVTPDPAADRLQIPGSYTVTFTVENTGNLSEDFDLTASNVGLPQNFITIVSVDGVPGPTTTITLASGATQDIDVVYSIPGAEAAGSIDSLSFIASSVAQPATLDESLMQVEVLRAVMTISKAVFEDDQVTPIAGTVLPGQFMQYRITVTNAGVVDASSIHVDDLLPAEVTYDSNTPDAAGWTITNAGNDVDADLAGTLAPAASRFFWIRVQIN